MKKCKHEHILTKEEYYSLFSDSITKKEYDRILEKIDKRFFEIIEYIFKVQGKKFEWCDYNNGDSRAEIDGWFDPERYETNISYEAGRRGPEPFDESFPTKWLFEEFEEEFYKEIKQFNDSIFEENEKLIESIKAKLTREELKVVKFK
jgi:hypothetical protein